MSTLGRIWTAIGLLLFSSVFCSFGGLLMTSGDGGAGLLGAFFILVGVLGLVQIARVLSRPAAITPPTSAGGNYFSSPQSANTLSQPTGAPVQPAQAATGLECPRCHQTDQVQAVSVIAKNAAGSDLGRKLMPPVRPLPLVKVTGQTGRGWGIACGIVVALVALTLFVVYVNAESQANAMMAPRPMTMTDNPYLTPCAETPPTAWECGSEMPGAIAEENATYQYVYDTRYDNPHGWLVAFLISLLGFLLVPLTIGVARRTALSSDKSRQQFWDVYNRRMPQWEKSYYCHRDGVVFVAGTQYYGAPEALYSVLDRAGGA